MRPGVEQRVAQEFAERQEVGIAKYGVTLQDNPLALIEWLQHLKEELMDATAYAQRVIEKLDEANVIPVHDMGVDQ